MIPSFFGTITIDDAHSPYLIPSSLCHAENKVTTMNIGTGGGLQGRGLYPLTDCNNRMKQSKLRPFFSIGSGKLKP